MEKTYRIDMDVTFSACLWVDAENEEDAKKVALDMMSRDPYYHTRNRCFLEAKIIDTFSEQD